MGELNTKMTALADAIRAKTGGTEKLTLDQMPTEIANISTGENLDAEVSTQETTIESIKTLLAEKANPQEAFFWDQLCRERLSYCVFPYNQRIKAGLFFTCYYLQWIDAPSCTGIGQYAFQQCSSLSRINAPGTKYVSNYAFYGAKNLPTVSFPQCSQTLNQAFLGCTSLSQIYLPAVTGIGERCFSGCTALKEINMSLCTSIGQSAFNGCTTLSKVAFPALSSTSTYVFQNCTSLVDVSLPALQYVHKYIFSGCTGLSTISLPAATTIDTYAFQNCTNLKSLYLLGSKVCKLGGSNAFNGSPLSAGGTGIIYVPASLYPTYSTSTNWTAVKARLSSVAGI